MPAAPTERSAPEGARWACTCARPAAWSRRRWLGACTASAAGVAAPAVVLGLSSPAAAAIAECERSGFTKAVSAEQIEQAAQQQYRQMLQQYSGQRAVAPKDHPQLQRLRAIADRLIPQAPKCNERARQWRWEVQLIGSNELNAFCMPGGKIAFYWGILARLQLSDDEVATIMGHEMAHALLEHAREQAGKNALTQGGLRLGAALLGLGNVGDMAAQGLSQLASLAYSRKDETEADRLGMLLAAQGGYDPAAGVTLWRKMMAASGGRTPPKILSTHPLSNERIQDIESRLPRARPLYEAAVKPERVWGPPPAPRSGTEQD